MLANIGKLVAAIIGIRVAEINELLSALGLEHLGSALLLGELEIVNQALHLLLTNAGVVFDCLEDVVDLPLCLVVLALLGQLYAAAHGLDSQQPVIRFNYNRIRLSLQSCSFIEELEF